MSCHDARERLSDLLDDALATEARAQVDAHLAGCADCRARARSPQGHGLAAARRRAAAGPGRLRRPCARRCAPGPLVSTGSSIGSPPSDFSDFPSRPPRWCSWPRSPSTSSRGHPNCDRQRARRVLRIKPATASCRARPGRPRRMSDRTVPEGHTQRSRHRSRQDPCDCRPAPTPPTSSLARTRGGPRAGADEGAVDLRGARGRARQFPTRVERLRAPPSLHRQRPARRVCLRVPRRPPAPCSARRTRAARRRVRSSRSGKTMRRAPVARPSGRRASLHRWPWAPCRCRIHPSAWRASKNSSGPSAPLPRGSPPLARQRRQRCVSCHPHHVVGRLTVKDRPSADRELAELVSRVGGAETARRTEAGGDTVDLVIPRAAYPAFAQGLARIGSWQRETEPPELPDRVPITLRITQ